MRAWKIEKERESKKHSIKCACSRMFIRFAWLIF